MTIYALLKAITTSVLNQSSVPALYLGNSDNVAARDPVPEPESFGNLISWTLHGENELPGDTSEELGIYDKIRGCFY